MRFPGGYRDDRGATAVEYGIIVALIAVVIVASVALLGNNLAGLFSDSGDTIGAAVAGELNQTEQGSGDKCTPEGFDADDNGNRYKAPTCSKQSGSWAWKCSSSTKVVVDGRITCLK